MRTFTLITLILTTALSLGCDVPYAESNSYTMLYVEHSGFPTIRDTLTVEPGTCESLLIGFERDGEYKLSIQGIDQVLLYPDLPGATEFHYVDAGAVPWASTRNPDPNTDKLPVHAGSIGEVQVCNPFSAEAQTVTYDVVFKDEDYEERMQSKLEPEPEESKPTNPMASLTFQDLYYGPDDGLAHLGRFGYNYCPMFDNSQIVPWAF